MRPLPKIAYLLGAAVVLVTATVLWRVHRTNIQNAKVPTKMSGRLEPVDLNASVQKAISGARQIVPDQIPKSGAAATPESLRLILNGDGSRLGYTERVKALHAINRNLTIEEVEALYRYLRPPTPQSGQDPVGENWLRNEMMDKLVQQDALPPGLSDLLVAIYHDPAQDVVMRDYAVQHMAPPYERVSDQEKTNLRDALWQATGETDTSIACTALLALLDVVGPMPSSGDDATANRSRLADTAFKLAADDHCGELARITAVQVCGRMQIEQALPVIEQLAQTAPSIPLRIAATAALGDIGGTEAMQLLQRLAQSPEPRQALAAQSALSRAEAASIKQAKR